MGHTVNAGDPRVITRRFWFHGYTYNTTPGSRTLITDTIRNGYAFAIDPEADIDFATLPSGMILKGNDRTGGRRVYNVTRPATGILSKFAGIATGLPAEGLVAADYANGYWIDLIISAESAPVWFQGDTSSTGFEDIIGLVNGQWYMSPLALGSNGANLPYVFARPLFRENVSSAALRPCSVGAFGYPYAQ